MMIYSVYEIATGRFTGVRLGTTGELNPDMVPAGCSVMPGEWDYECWTADHATGNTSAKTPPPEDWRIRKYREADAAMADILSAEADQARPIREVILGLATGSKPDPVAVARLTAVKARIDAARSRYTTLAAAATETELDALLSIHTRDKVE